MISDIVTQTDLPLNVLNRGKVRDIYDLEDNLLIITTDRISAFDYVLPSSIPSKGVCLTQLSKFWFDYTVDIVKNHLISTELYDFPDKLRDYSGYLEDRTMLVKKTKVIPIECIVRGYISGSAWKSYKKDGTVCGIKLPSSLEESEQFDEPLFTPSTKAEIGHDINISFEKMKELVGRGVAEQLEEFSLNLYITTSEYARKRGIIIADTKFEFGLLNAEIILIDEVLTPDSSRFWPADKYEAGRDQESFDKQFVRNYLESINFDKSGPGLELPDDIVAKTSDKYIQAYEQLTGLKFKFRS